MATQDHVRIVEYLIKYEFEIKSWAFIALTAAGAEEFNHHGNRMCARYGRLLIELYVLNNTHKAGVPPCVSPPTEIPLVVFSLLILLHSDSK